MKTELLVVEITNNEDGSVRAALVREGRKTPVYEVTRSARSWSVAGEGVPARARAIDALLAGAGIIADSTTGGHHRTTKGGARVEVSLGLRILA